MNEHKIAEKIDHAAMELLKDPGIKLDHDEICKMLLDAMVNRFIKQVS